MPNSNAYQWAAIGMGLGSAALTAISQPESSWIVLIATLLGGYVGTLLPDINSINSSAFHTIKSLSRLAAILVPCIQFFYRPADLLLGLPLALFMIRRFWDVLPQLIHHSGHTHSVVAAVCLSLGVSWVGYLTAGVEAALPVFLASVSGYIFHLILEDISNDCFFNTHTTKQPALTPIGYGSVVELSSIVAIGVISMLGFWTL